jgi:aspartyl-tRNA(Asn)/glutamyl-tRNA(Gln) amidotransferase subunit A
VSGIPTIAEAGALIAQRKLSPVELTHWCLDRIDRLDDSIHAFLHVAGERALVEAKAAEAEIMADGCKGPLHGIPIAHKDIYCTQGIPTTAHSRVLMDHVPQEDAFVVRRLAAAGTVMLGKLATHEFAWGGPSFDLPWPPARNPWNARHFTGGSSSGTAAAVAAGLVLGGTGSDSGGSIRMPASFCGVAGFKPTYGLCSRTGILPLAGSLDHPGPLAWTAEDCAILLQAMAGYDPSDPAGADVAIPNFRSGLEEPVAGLRIGFVRHFHEEDDSASEAVRRALEEAARVFRDLGADVREVRLAPLADWSACGIIILAAEAYAFHEERLKSQPHLYGESFRDRALMGAFLDAADYLAAQRMRAELCEAFERAMRDVDLLLCAITPDAAPPIEAVQKMGTFERPSCSFPFNMTGAPALALRSGFTENGMPLGMQLAGRPFEDALVLRAGHHYERATCWSQRRPSMALAG